MNKLYWLSGIIVLGVIANVGAMEQRPLAWQQLDQFTNQEPINWDGVFRVLHNYRNDLKLINKYRDLIYDEPLLELAVEEYNVPAAHRLLKEFGAQVTNEILYEAKSYVDDKGGLVELLYQYGASQ